MEVTEEEEEEKEEVAFGSWRKIAEKIAESCEHKHCTYFVASPQIERLSLAEKDRRKSEDGGYFLCRINSLVDLRVSESSLGTRKTSGPSCASFRVSKGLL